MESKQTEPKTIDEYIVRFPPDVQEILEKIRQTIRETAPSAEETIKYGMPTFTLRGGNLVYFAGFKNHIGFYRAPTVDPAFKKDLAGYKQGSGSVQFPLDKPIPYGLIRKMVKFRAQENANKAAEKRKKK